MAHRYAATNGYANPSVYCKALFDVVTRVYFSILNEESRAYGVTWRAFSERAINPIPPRSSTSMSSVLKSEVGRK